MMKMNKIIGILLAVCFLMSVTAAAVSAAKENNNYGGKDNNYGGKDKNFNDYNKCHTEYKRVLVKIIYKHHGKPIKIYKWKAFKVCKPVYRGHR